MKMKSITFYKYSHVVIIQRLTTFQYNNETYFSNSIGLVKTVIVQYPSHVIILLVFSVMIDVEWLTFLFSTKEKTNCFAFWHVYFSFLLFY